MKFYSAPGRYPVALKSLKSPLPADFLVETSLWPLAGSKLGVHLAASGRDAGAGAGAGAGSAGGGGGPGGTGHALFVGVDVDNQVLSVELWDSTTRSAQLLCGAHEASRRAWHADPAPPLFFCPRRSLPFTHAHAPDFADALNGNTFYVGGFAPSSQPPRPARMRARVCVCACVCVCVFGASASQPIGVLGSTHLNASQMPAALANAWNMLRVVRIGNLLSVAFNPAFTDAPPSHPAIPRGSVSGGSGSTASSHILGLRLTVDLSLTRAAARPTAEVGLAARGTGGRFDYVSAHSVELLRRAGLAFTRTSTAAGGHACAGSNSSSPSGCTGSGADASAAPGPSDSRPPSTPRTNPRGAAMISATSLEGAGPGFNGPLLNESVLARFRAQMRGPRPGGAAGAHAPRARARRSDLHPTFPYIINLGFPKTGSTSLQVFMTKIYAKYKTPFKSCHWSAQKQMVCDLLHKAENTTGNPLRFAELPPASCHTIAQGDCESIGHTYFPQMSMLEQLMLQLPEAKFLMMTRDGAAWVNSIKAWGNPPMYGRLVKASLPGAPPGFPQNDTGMIAWQQDHYERVRTLARKTQAQFFEFSLENGDPEDLVAFLGLLPADAEKWGHHNCKASCGGKGKRGGHHADEQRHEKKQNSSSTSAPLSTSGSHSGGGQHTPTRSGP